MDSEPDFVKVRIVELRTGMGRASEDKRVARLHVCVGRSHQSMRACMLLCIISEIYIDRC